MTIKKYKNQHLVNMDIDKHHTAEATYNVKKE